MRYNIACQGLTTLEEVDFPNGITELNCSFNQLTSLAGFCPASASGACPQSLQVLDCSDNQLTSLEHCSQSLQVLFCDYNQLTSLEHAGLCPASASGACPLNLQNYIVVVID